MASLRLSTKKGPNPVSRHRRRQAQRDFEYYAGLEVEGETPSALVGVLVRERAPETKRTPNLGWAAGTHGRLAHCPGSFAFGVLGGGVFKSN